MFAATVTAVTPHGTWARTAEGIEGRIMRGHKKLAPGQAVNLRLIGADSVHGFIDFEFPEGIEPKKVERAERKRDAATRLEPLIGELFDAVITGVSPKATWLHTSAPDEVDGRLVRGMAGLKPGDRVKAILLAADPARGYIDFARAE
jgi:hypothetical protein